MLFYVVHYDGTPWVEQHINIAWLKKSMFCETTLVLYCMAQAVHAWFVRPLVFSIACGIILLDHSALVLYCMDLTPSLERQ